jgi:outer membrane receptor for ferrienterochelin and colicin
MTDTLLSSVESHYKGNEFSFYAEDDMRLTRKLRINLGGRYTMYQVSGAVYHSLEPRISASYRLFSRTTLKVSYTEMSQFAHQLSNSYLNLPTKASSSMPRTTSSMASSIVPQVKRM